MSNGSDVGFVAQSKQLPHELHSVSELAIGEGDAMAAVQTLCDSSQWPMTPTALPREGEQQLCGMRRNAHGPQNT